MKEEEEEKEEKKRNGKGRKGTSSNNLRASIRRSPFPFSFFLVSFFPFTPFFPRFHSLSPALSAACSSKRHFSYGRNSICLFHPREIENRNTREQCKNEDTSAPPRWLSVFDLPYFAPPNFTSWPIFVRPNFDFSLGGMIWKLVDLKISSKKKKIRSNRCKLIVDARLIRKATANASFLGFSLEIPISSVVTRLLLLFQRKTILLGEQIFVWCSAGFPLKIAISSV